MKNSCDTTQKQLVEKAERAHYEGIRHTGLSGTVCEDLLIEALRSSLEVTRLNFDRGVIKFASKEAKGNELNGLMSPQMDIIVYKGEPTYKTMSQVVVQGDQVKGVIEVKKWANLKTMRESVKEKIVKVRDLLNQNLEHNVPMFFVTFRYHDRGSFHNWVSAMKSFSTPHAYCFSGNFSSRGGVNLYPWEESWWNDFEHYPYRGQYGQLVRDVTMLAK